MKDFFNYFAGTGFPLTTIIMVMVVILLFIVMMIYLPVLTRKILPKFGYARYSQYLPFKTVYNDNSIELTNGDLIRVWHVRGVQTSMQDDATKE